MKAVKNLKVNTIDRSDSKGMKYFMLKVFQTGLKIVIGTVVSAVFIVPLLWLVLTPFNKIPAYSISLPKQWTLEHFTTLFANNQAMLSLFNSLFYSLSAALATTFIGGLAAYALSRTKFKGQNAITYVILLVSSVGAGTAAMVPLFQMMYSIGLINTETGLILVLAAVGIPSAIFVLKDFMDSIPKYYEESARLMGAGPFLILWDVVTPIARPGIAFVAIWALKNSWSDFLVPYLLLSDTAKQPAAVIMYTFYTEGGQADVGMLTAFAVLFSIPAIAIYLIINRRWGFSFGGGLKG